MNRLTKAEWFRLRHTGHLIWYVIIIAIAFLFMPYILCMDRLDQPLDVLLPSIATLVIMMYNFIPAGIAGISGQVYNKGKIGYYEVMAGNSPHSIIMSKVCSDGVFFSVIGIISTLGFYIFMAIRNGLGNVDHPFIRLGLYSVVMIHMVLISIMIMMTSKKPITGAVLAYIRFMIFDIAVFNVAMAVARHFELFTIEENVMHMIVMNQMEMAMLAPINKMVVLHIVFGAMFEFAFWYIIVYRGIKKKRFN